MTLFYTDIIISAPSEEILERIMANPFLTDQAFKEYYSAHGDDRTYLCDPEYIDATTPTIKYHASTRGLEPIDYCRSLMDRTDDDIIIEIKTVDEMMWPKHYRLMQNTLYEVYDQHDFEMELEANMFNRTKDQDDLYGEYLYFGTPLAWTKNLDVDNAGVCYGDVLDYPYRLIPDEMKGIPLVDPFSLKKRAYHYYMICMQ